MDYHNKLSILALETALRLGAVLFSSEYSPRIKEIVGLRRLHYAYTTYTERFDLAHHFCNSLILLVGLP
jgi:hypothetical protein